MVSIGCKYKYNISHHNRLVSDSPEYGGFAAYKYYSHRCPFPVLVGNIECCRVNSYLCNPVGEIVEAPIKHVFGTCQTLEQRDLTSGGHRFPGNS